MSQKVRVRFAPSPTGPLHIGGVRTALFNYLFAQQHGGDFILRIEDTDQTRFVPGAEQYIIDSLAWCNIKFNEGVSVGGPHAPYRQSERKELYRQYADMLIASGNAYYAFDTPEETDKLRKQYEQEGKAFSYDASVRGILKNSLSMPAAEVQELISKNTPYVVRFKIPENTTLAMHDMIRGEVTVNTSILDDKVLYKSDGMPTYHLANVVDDHLMQITHVIRGEEWLPSMPLHVLLYKAFGWEASMPQFAHLPLILKPTGKGKLSKRDGDAMGFPVFPLQWKTAEGEIYSGYREWGYLPQAFTNMLALLGWNAGTEQEIFTMDELIKLFSLDKVNKAGARFDPEKAKWFNQQYIKTLDDSRLVEIFTVQLQQRNISANAEVISRVCHFVKERISLTTELWDHAYYFFEAPKEYDAKVIAKVWKDQVPDALKDIRNILSGVQDFSSAVTETTVKNYITEKALNLGQVMNAFRLAIVGKSFGVHLFDIIAVIGKEETCRRIDKAVERISGQGIKNV